MEPAELVAGVVTVGGTIVRGATAIKDSGNVTVASARFGPLTLSLDALSQVCFQCRRPAPSGAPAGVQLANGDFLPADALTFSPASIRVKGPLGELDVPIARVAMVRLRPVALERAEAVVLFENGDLLRGALKSAAPDALTVETAGVAVKGATTDTIDVVFPARFAYLSDLEVTVGSRGLNPEGVACCAATRTATAGRSPRRAGGSTRGSASAPARR